MEVELTEEEMTLIRRLAKREHVHLKVGALTVSGKEIGRKIEILKSIVKKLEKK